MLRLSKNGSVSNTITSAVGTPTATRLSIEPGTSFKSWYSGRKYHSGRGTYAVSVGSAGGSSGAPSASASSTIAATTASDTMASFPMISGQKRTPARFVAAYASR